MFDLIFPILLIILGIIYRVHLPQNRDSRFSYRTKASLKNETNWQKAHRLLGFYWILTGCLLLVFSLILAFIPMYAFVRSSILLATSIFAVLLSIILVEKKLK
ncbi:SdpI family protein [Listeria sp. FSL L7-1517]|uniref:SdpI family protein n=1 Tax=Listeria immobilis TaxID=2713502 RepID=UPI00164E27DA|nr:SdpI family protein [Listeria immobilis]MBC6298064.1 SdpI family protein [Listeria immobilis]